MRENNTKRVADGRQARGSRVCAASTPIQCVRRSHTNEWVQHVCRHTGMPSLTPTAPWVLPEPRARHLPRPAEDPLTRASTLRHPRHPPVQQQGQRPPLECILHIHRSPLCVVLSMHSSRGVYPTSAAHDSKMAGRTHGWVAYRASPVGGSPDECDTAHSSLRALAGRPTTREQRVGVGVG